MFHSKNTDSITLLCYYKQIIFTDQFIKQNFKNNIYSKRIYNDILNKVVTCHDYQQQ